MDRARGDDVDQAVPDMLPRARERRGLQRGGRSAAEAQYSAPMSNLPLLDIARHTRLQNIGQVISCLDIICEAFEQVRGDPDATFCGFDREGHCFIAQETQQNILKVWRKVIANQELIAADQSARLPSALATRDADVTESLQTAPGQTDMNVSGAVAHP